MNWAPFRTRATTFGREARSCLALINIFIVQKVHLKLNLVWPGGKAVFARLLKVLKALKASQCSKLLSFAPNDAIFGRILVCGGWQSPRAGPGRWNAPTERQAGLAITCSRILEKWTQRT